MAFYFGILKEPRGLIRLLQFIFAIFAFATACNGSSYLYIKKGSDDKAVSISWSYPYNLQDTQININFNATQNPLSSSNGIKPSAEFFVFTGVTSMLLSLAFLVLYVVTDRLYRYDERIPIIDFILIIIWAIFWIAGSSAWAQGVSSIRSQTSFNYVYTLVPECAVDPKCEENESGTYANITVSVIFGFLNFLLWLGSMWFVYKETKFFKSQTAQQYPQQNNFTNISGPNMQQQQQQQPQTRVPGTMG
ncbi:unnamed protein product [Rotaria sordida]|uniref:MARVEL domain-containing protein n=1 Tax=Rotaria sordida TaxID=392033 RepID=A0A814DD16_9BILA|nr:unnamed protein product [Rotaria sordida]